jgi:hypothetical protein
MKIRKSGKFYLRITKCPHVECVAVHECIEGNLHNVQFGVVTILLQIFWLWWILEISNPITTKGYGKSLMEDVSSEHLPLS